MERLLLLASLLERHLLHTRRSFDDALFDLDIELYNVTLVLAVGSHIITVFILLMGIINYYYVCFKTLFVPVLSFIFNRPSVVQSTTQDDSKDKRECYTSSKIRPWIPSPLIPCVCWLGDQQYHCCQCRQNKLIHYLPSQHSIFYLTI